jgi:hypothetical protein
MGILLVGFGVNLTLGSPPMKPLAILGGILWPIGFFSQLTCFKKYFKNMNKK